MAHAFRYLTGLLLTALSYSQATAQHDNKYDPTPANNKAALHKHYRDIVLKTSKRSKQEKNTMKALMGAWESVTDSTLPARSHAKIRTNAIKKHGLAFSKDDAMLHNFYSDSMHRTRWQWGVRGDTIIYFVDAHMYGDTSVIVEQIISLTKERVVFKTLSRDTLSTTVPCYTRQNIHASLSMTKPQYPGDMHQYLRDGLKGFNPQGENYKVLVKFLVNCKGEIGYAYPLIHNRNEFEQQVIDLIKKSGKWKPASYNGEPYDYYNHIEVQWNKGFIDFWYPKMNY